MLLSLSDDVSTIRLHTTSVTRQGKVRTFSGLMQGALQETEETLQQLLTKVESDPKLRGDAARGVIRGPQLAQVELELRKMAYIKQRHERQEGKEQQRREALVVEQDSNTAEGHSWQPKGEPERQGDEAEGRNAQAKGEQERQGEQAESQEETRALAEAVLTYYRQLGHMLSCAADLR